MDNISIPTTSHGVAKPVTDEERAKDNIGFTDPNLHRRIDPSHPEEETADRKYTLGIYDGIHSYRTVEKFHHDEESTTCEIP